MSAAQSAGEALLVVVSPVALALDGESVRVARDVLGAAFAMKAVVPEDLAELEHALSRRGRRRLVVIGDDQALHEVVQLLHRHAELEAGPIGIIPVGTGQSLGLSRSLGAASRPVEAARAVARGAERRLDLLVDEDGGVVLGNLWIPGRAEPRAGRAEGSEPGPREAGGGPRATSERASNERTMDADPHEACSPRANSAASGRGSGGLIGSWCSQLGRTAQAAARAVTGPLLAHGDAPADGEGLGHREPWPGGSGQRGSSGGRSGKNGESAGAGADRAGAGRPGQYLRVEADGRLLADLDRPVGPVSVRNASAAGSASGLSVPDDGLVEVLIGTDAELGAALRVRAQQITVTGGTGSTGNGSALFTYEADHTLSSPVHERTWTVVPGAWRLTVPLGTGTGPLRTD